MDIHEYQGKKLFKDYGIPVPIGFVATTSEEAAKYASQIKGKIVVKAQIHAGGRGKGAILGNAQIKGVKVVNNATEAQSHTEQLLGHVLVTHQTGPEGRKVQKVLVETGCAIVKELYIAILLDRDKSRVTFIASTEGGMDIEAVAAKTPEAIFKQSIEPATGFSSFHGRNLAAALQLNDAQTKQAIHLFGKLYQLFLEKDASLIEINPLVITESGDLLALDAKINFDDNALFRHSDILALRDLSEEDPKERAAKDANLSYVSLDGNIGCLVNGAGLAMATMDIIKYEGGAPANFLDVGGSATAEMVTQAFKIILADPNVKAILVNIFGGIAKCDVIANGVVTAAKEVGLKVPLVVRLKGTNVELGKKILLESQIKIITADDMSEAAQKVVAAAKGGAA